MAENNAILGRAPSLDGRDIERQLEKKTLKNYRTTIDDHEKNKANFYVQDTKEAEDKERIDLEQKLAKMRNIKEISGIPEPDSHKNVEEEIKREDREQELEIPQIEEVMDVSAPEERELSEEDVLIEKGEFKATPETGTSSEAESVLENEGEAKEALDILENYRESKTIEGNGNIRYFKNNGKIILDGISLISFIVRRLDKVKRLYQELSQAVSPRDQFFLKQDTINNQEMLKDLIKRTIKMCEQESCSLPEYTTDIMNIQNLQEILEILYLQNWSNEYEFKAFADYFESLSNAFHEKITPSEDYMKSILRAIRM